MDFFRRDSKLRLRRVNLIERFLHQASDGHRRTALGHDGDVPVTADPVPPAGRRELPHVCGQARRQIVRRGGEGDGAIGAELSPLSIHRLEEVIVDHDLDTEGGARRGATAPLRADGQPFRPGVNGDGAGG